jgi:hypothetical protein
MGSPPGRHRSLGASGSVQTLASKQPLERSSRGNRVRGIITQQQAPNQRRSPGRMLAAKHECGLKDAVGVGMASRWLGSIIGRQCRLTPITKSLDQMTHGPLSQRKFLGDLRDSLSRPPATADHPTDRDRDGTRHETTSGTKAWHTYLTSMIAAKLLSRPAAKGDVARQSTESMAPGKIFPACSSMSRRRFVETAIDSFPRVLAYHFLWRLKSSVSTTRHMLGRPRQAQPFAASILQ